ncbi:tetratricopeptide repeat protein [Bradyrhizobium daqingense]|uniref:protein O-GlcNAc transferase n=1 Tax=Bradyrhizobium daqingense TaxID=993502 RepID=A0A562KTM6_9BRAD|nr:MULTISPECIES: tetratricopeptide repeat protein [Bradyrhizobium]MDQ8731278.1 tetratricopeptide repeat protein [Bradyrhizobium sp. LHD-71]TWH98771.1 putative O-linked N-acetylglucosamine transferase (SPINDLY family) [Bradyrhizobium daqingense]UFS87884.1 tetratricopeptide repeat protein [Bradyrhizobium daqingense]
MGNSVGQRAFHKARLEKRQKAEILPMLGHALQLHKMGLLPEAQTAYRQLLQLAPNQFIALHMLGILESDAKNYQQAEILLSRAVAVDPRSADAHMSLGVALNGLRRHDAACASYRKALALRPNHAVTFSNLGNASVALELHEEALHSYDKALALNPDLAEAHNGRGWALCRRRNYDEAIASLNRALSIKPDYAAALANRAIALRELQRFDEALADANRAIALAPDDANGWLARAGVLLQIQQIAQASHDCEQALAIDPSSIQAHMIQGLCLAGLGRVDEALASFDRALDIQPDLQSAISNKIFTLDFAEDATVERHQQARQVWWERVGSKIASESSAPHDNSREPDRRLVLGYVSSDFNAHSAAFIFKPVLEHHDRTQFEIVCYACSSKMDATTSEFKKIADRWRDASQWTDDRLAAEIRADGVDILIDLSGHTRGNRLGVFARKPAPIQVHGWGHGTGTGLPTIDYLFSDPVAIPSAVRHLFAETIVDLPCFVTLAPLPDGIARTPAPAMSNGFVTFGVFNRISKISDEAVDVWSRILERVPGSRLLIKDVALDDQLVRGNLLARFAACRLPAERVDLLGATLRSEHLASFNRVDICLDPFPQNGGVSTWEALQMGVPVVAKLGSSLPSRAAGAILTALGLPDWVADSEEAYVEIAATRAAGIADLDRLRRDLPGRINASAAGNAFSYARGADAAYRAMWKRYCDRGA